MSRNKIIKLFTWLCIVTCCISCVGCGQKREPLPILKVRTSYQSGYLPLLNKQFYIVYDNGKTKRISEFESSDTTVYYFVLTDYDLKRLSGIDVNTDEGKRLNRIAESIISLTAEDDTLSSPEAMYLISDKIYFSITAFKESGNLSAVFEYIESDNSICEIAAFKGSIEYMEAYQ